MLYSHVELSQRSVVDNALRNPGEDLVQKCWTRAWSRSVVGRCCRVEAVGKSVGEKL